MMSSSCPLAVSIRIGISRDCWRSPPAVEAVELWQHDVTIRSEAARQRLSQPLDRAR